MKRDIKLCNLIFPTWFFWLLPITWIVVLPANFIVDSAVILIILKLQKQEGVFSKYRKTILRVFGVGLLSDFIGLLVLAVITILLLAIDSIYGAGRYLTDIINGICINPFQNIISLVIVLSVIAFTGFLIYRINLKISFEAVDMDAKQKRILAAGIAVLTSPYLFLLPYKFFNPNI